MAMDRPDHMGHETGRLCDILVVEDDPTTRHTIAEILELEGYRVLSARDGADALRVLDRARPWLILLDVQMPVMKGGAFAHEVRRRQVPTRIVLLTGANEPDALAAELQADGYLAKPFQMHELLECVGGYRPQGPALAS
jgi:two-component system response regulator MprA